MQISQLMTWYNQPNLIKYDEKRYLSQFAAEMLDSLQYDSTKCARKYELKILVTTATYCVLDLHNIKGISGHLERCIFIFANGAWYDIQQAYKCVSSSLWPRLTRFGLKIPNMLKSSRLGLERVSCHGNINIYSCRCVSYTTISLPCFNSLRCKLAKIVLFISFI